MFWPFLTCHHKSGSTANMRPTIKTAPTSIVPSIAGNETTRFRSESESPALVLTAAGARALADAHASEAGISIPSPPTPARHAISDSLMVVSTLHHAGHSPGYECTSLTGIRVAPPPLAVPPFPDPPPVVVQPGPPMLPHVVALTITASMLSKFP